MKRYLGLSSLVLTVLLASNATAQRSPQQSLVEKLGSLREGWSFSSDQDEQPLTTPQRVAQRTTPERNAAVATDAARPFPRVNPKELLPRNWFGVDPKPAPAAPSRVATDQAGAAGSARARLLRDMRRTPSASEGAAMVEVAQRSPSPRAGSVLSPNAPQFAASAPADEAQLARSIAEEVADVMAAETPTPAATDEATTPPVEAEEEPLFAEATQGESLLPFGDIEGPTPTESAPTMAAPITPIEEEPVAAVEAPVAEPEPEVVAVETAAPEPAIPEPQVAEGDAGRVSVAARNNNTTKLPLVIGDRYSIYQNTAEVESVVEPQPAADAFAAGPAGSETKPAIDAQAVAEAKAEADDLLLTQRMPVLVSKVSGPRTIVVGREATYRVLLANRGDVGADQVVTRVTVPEWAEVVDVQTVEGAVERGDSLADEGTLVWRTDHVAAGEVTKLDLRLIARSGRPIELGLTHSHRPIDGRTLVEVQEPKLSLALIGPEDVLYGKAQSYRLTITNPGTGTAENVVLHLTPPGGDIERRTSHDFGAIGAGEDRTVEIELTAREAGRLAVNASASAEGGVTADVTKEVFCRKAELVVDWRGPSERYAGAPALYYFRVRNPGTATAPGVVLNVELPEGFDVLPGDATPAVRGGKLAFQAGAMRPDEEKFFELRGVMRLAGANEIAFRAAATDQTLSDRVTAVTDVTALADLKLDILDPKGPVATGEEVAYEVRVTNRGMNDARDVRVIGLFSDGIEPHHVEGGPSQSHDGRVAFETIDRIAAGEVRVFKIFARAFDEGTHLFRAEVLCRDLDIKLAAEETTRFFLDEPIDVAADGYPAGEPGSRFSR